LARREKARRTLAFWRADVVKIAVGLVLGFLIGAGCRWFDIPTPSPPTLLGACLVVALTLGYVAVDWLLAK
jgi:XapX domain-containing protein